VVRAIVACALLVAALVGRAGEVSGFTTYTGMCDASGAVAVNDELFVVADDEDNGLRIYHAHKGGPPVRAFDTTSFLKVDPREPEVDLEGAARIGCRVYWITSHGRNRNGKYRESRLRFFATDIVTNTAGIELKPAGRFYSNLLLDLFNDPRLARFRLDRAAHLAPKARGGFNIEGLSATPDGKLMIGFRNPIPNGRALMVPLLNPTEVIDAGKPVQLGDPLLLDLGGRGIRSIALYGHQFVIIAGAYDETMNAKIYFWKGGAAKAEPLAVDVTAFNPEALAIYPGEKAFEIFSDDGTRLVNGVQCKHAPPADRSFRAAWINP